MPEMRLNAHLTVEKNREFWGCSGYSGYKATFDDLNNGQTLIFSLLNVRKKTAAITAGLAIGATCLWAIAEWQNISRGELLSILFASLLMLGCVMVMAILMVAVLKLSTRLIKRTFHAKQPSNQDHI